jgi:hypothetical protein
MATRRRLFFIQKRNSCVDRLMKYIRIEKEGL